MLIDFVWMMPVVSLKDATVVAKGEEGEDGEVTIVRITALNLCEYTAPNQFTKICFEKNLRSGFQCQ